MSARYLFISDLHLEPERPDITRSLVRFLADNRGNCQALYILGDLFEVWVGDDSRSPLADTVAEALQQFAAAGSQVLLMHGNRDFLLGSDFAARCGASLVNEPRIIESPAGPVLLLHGDSLCTDDVEYQQFRTLVRSRPWQQEFLSQSLAQRQAFADKARQQSQSATANKAMHIMDVNPVAVLELLHASKQTTLLHGHTHRPAVHTIALDTPIQGSTQATRIVLGSWEEQAWYAASTRNGFQLHHFPLL